jgi:iron complex outermembrane receptor protein
MIKRMIFIAALAMTSFAAYAKEMKSDSMNVIHLQEVQVTATRANKTTPMTFVNISKKDIQKQNTGIDIPFLLSLTPSVTTSSDAGTGIGYTSIYVRGSDPSRINVTANGIPMNDSESSQVYWVNINDFASSVSSIQIQRGIGTSTNGASAFGATVNMQTDAIPEKPFASLNLSGGSYGTHKETISFGTGLLGEHWGFNGRLSDIGSDGYIDRASAKLNSYFLQGGYYGKKTSVKLITFNGQERTYHAWDYATKEQMSEYGRSYNPCGLYTDASGKEKYYNNQIDQYHQQHYQMLWNQIINSYFNFNIALHYTHGNGYYEQMKDDADLYNYYLSDKSETNYSDLVRRKMMKNNFFGTVYSLNYEKDKFNISFGGGWNKYIGDHFGNVIWVENPVSSWMPNYEYYRNRAKKTDNNFYGKLQYTIIKGLNAYIDLQYRHINYKLQDPDDGGVLTKSANYKFNDTFDFFNPKAGLFYQIDRNNNVYVSFAISHREPTRNDYEGATADSKPKAEKMNDLECGYKYQSPTFTGSINVYYMSYKDQFVLTGEQNAIGEMMAKNVGKSYRTGIELSAGWKPIEWLRWDVNATFSNNKAKNWMVEMYDTKENVNLGNTHLSFSPDVIFNNILTFEYKGISARLNTKYIGKQYMTNTGFKSFVEDGKDVSMMLDAFFVSDADFAYTFKLNGIKSITLGATIYNIFNEKYESFGSAYASFKRSNSQVIACQDDQYNAYSVYSAQAPIHFLAHLSINF